MASHGADGDGVALSPADLVVYPRDVLGSPGGVVPVADDDVGGLNESPLEVLVGGFAHVPEVGLAAAGVHGRHDAGIGGELACGAKAIDGADLALDHDGQDVPNSGKALQQLDGGGKSNPLSDALFELSDLVLQGIESLELLSNTTPRFRRKPRKSRLQPSPACANEDVAVFTGRDAVLGQGSVDAVLQGGAELGEGHAGAVELTFIADLSGGQPDSGETVEVEERGQALGVELVGLVDIAHHQLGLGGVRQERNAAGGLDLDSDPVPVPDTLQGDRRASG